MILHTSQTTCRQCEDPWCGNACPVQAIVTDDRGIRVVDETNV